MQVELVSPPLHDIYTIRPIGDSFLQTLYVKAICSVSSSVIKISIMCVYKLRM